MEHEVTKMELLHYIITNFEEFDHDTNDNIASFMEP